MTTPHLTGVLEGYISVIGTSEWKPVQDSSDNWTFIIWFTDNTGAIVGAVLGALLLIALVVLVVFLVLRYMRQRGKDQWHFTLIYQ